MKNIILLFICCTIAAVDGIANAQDTLPPPPPPLPFRHTWEDLLPEERKMFTTYEKKIRTDSSQNASIFKSLRTYLDTTVNLTNYQVKKAAQLIAQLSDSTSRTYLLNSIDRAYTSESIGLTTRWLDYPFFVVLIDDSTKTVAQWKQERKLISELLKRCEVTPKKLSLWNSLLNISFGDSPPATKKYLVKLLEENPNNRCLTENINYIFSTSK